ncbi:uncharacterized protein LOC124269297 isoform X2 [Haliotis rubra]|uniref:uncharacterized protein LOC124269297 isoform X2 n=1 Tax=Haliotis rubra TaxID=36100 RepID=UPI001EE55BCE|nr:uncharacterized protein LOC124269297 isoform X2 [Haliotis rubra]
MSRDRHRGVLPATFGFAVYMFLLIHHEFHQLHEMPSTSLSDRWTTSPYLPTAIAVLSAVITFGIVSFIFHRMKVALEQKRKGDQLVNSSQTKRLIGSYNSKVMSFSAPIIIYVPEDS